MKLTRKNTADTGLRPLKVLQFGEGNFLRAFADWMIGSMNQNSDFNAGVVVVQPMPSGMIDKLKEQDGLYHVVMSGYVNGEAKQDITRIDALQEFVNPYTHYEHYLKTAELESIEWIISNTTEAGIVYREDDRLEGPQVGFPSKLTAWLYHRFIHFNGDLLRGVKILPCELIDRNGDQLKEIVLAHANQWSLGSHFTNWLEQTVVFTNTLVDRIVPGFPKDKIERIHETIGFEDQLVVESEHFHLWVIEGPLSLQDALPSEAAGLNLVVTEDMTPFRTRKVRILNGAHSLLVPIALLAGLELVKESVEHELVGPYLMKTLTEEVLPGLGMPMDVVNDYLSTVIDRFRNPFIAHYLESIALNSISKTSARVVPSVVAYYDTFKCVPKGLAFSVAALIKLYDGKTIALKDDAYALDTFNNIWNLYYSSEVSVTDLVEKILGDEKLWGENLMRLEGFSTQVSTYLEAILQKPMLTCLKEA